MKPKELREARLKLGLTQEQLAERLQIPMNTIARWERGELNMDKPELLRLAMEHLSCRPKRPAPKKQ